MMLPYPDFAFEPIEIIVSYPYSMFRLNCPLTAKQGRLWPISRASLQGTAAIARSYFQLQRAIANFPVKNTSDILQQINI